MAITKRIPESDPEGDPFGLSAAGQHCFFCDDMLIDPSQMWKGGNGENIYLHPDCVLHWVGGLIRDAHALIDSDMTMQEFLTECVMPNIKYTYDRHPVRKGEEYGK